MRRRFFRVQLLFAAAALLAAGCKDKTISDLPPTVDGGTPAADHTPRSGADAPANIAGNPPAKPRGELWKEFSGDKAMEEVKKQIDIGPRPSGSADLEKARVLITESLKTNGWDVQRQEFTDDTPRGPTHFVNLIARFPANGGRPVSAASQQVIVCSHYDTKRYALIRFVGASDGASSTGALLELARVAARDPAFAAKLELVFFDGEEAMQNFTETDGLWGSRHYAKDLRESGRAKQFKFAILWDMIGDKDLTITLPPSSPPDLAKGVFAAAEALGVRQNFGYFHSDILDDQVPLERSGHIKAIDIIDLDYMYWHTADDTIDKLSPDSLRKVGQVTLYYLQQMLQ